MSVFTAQKCICDQYWTVPSCGACDNVYRSWWPYAIWWSQWFKVQILYLDSPKVSSFLVVISSSVSYFSVFSHSMPNFSDADHLVDKTLRLHRLLCRSTDITLILLFCWWYWFHLPAADNQGFTDPLVQSPALFFRCTPAALSDEPTFFIDCSHVTDAI